MSTLRAAREADVDAITRISMAAMEADPVVPYRYPYRKEFPEEYEKFTRIRFGQFLAEENTVINVVELPSNEDASVAKPVAFSIWKLPAGAPTTTAEATPSPLDAKGVIDDARRPGAFPGPPDNYERRDANPARMAAFRAALGRAKHEHFDSKYGNDQLYLGLLACHPNYQGRGAGRKLLQWGLDKAKAESIGHVTLYASPMGQLLYRRMGFRDVGTYRTQVEGEDEYFDTLGMVLDL